MDSNSSQKSVFPKITIAIAVAVLVPLSFFIIAKALKKDRIKMPPHYIVERIDSVVSRGSIHYDTVYHQVGELRLQNQLGDMVSLNGDLKDKVLVIDFFFTNCPVVCPKLTSNLTLLQKAFRKDPKKEVTMTNDVQIISITVNPERDSFPALRAYADRFGVNHDHWWFLTGPKQTIYEFARNELAVVAEPGDGGTDDFIHTEKIVVVDQDRYIRGYYDGLDTAAIAKAAYDVSLITMEKKRKKKI